MNHKIFGHTRERQIFWQAFESGNMPHAWIFKGVYGIGKATFAKALSLKIFTQIHPHIKPELIARQITNNSYPNFFYLSSEKLKQESISIDQSRQLINFLNQTPVLDGWRIVCIDAVEDLTSQASNALLKILEEPPTKTIFLLITHNYGLVLPTIRSRACQLAFHSLSQEDMEQAITQLQLPRSQFLFNLSMGQPGMYQKFSKLPQDFFNDFKQAVNDAINNIKPNINKLFDIDEILLRTIYIIGVKKTEELAPSINFNGWSQRYSAIQKFISQTKETHLDHNHRIAVMFLLLKNYDYLYEVT